MKGNLMSFSEPPVVESASVAHPPPLPPPERTFNERYPFPLHVEACLITVALIVLQVIVGMMIGVVFAIVASVRERGYQEVMAENMHLMFVANVLAFAPFLVYGWWRVAGPFKKRFGLEPVSAGVVVSAFLLAVGTNITLSEFDNILRNLVTLPRFGSELFQDLFKQPLTALVVVGIVAPFTEEPLFRGLMQLGLMRRGHRWWAVVFTSLLFAVMHLSPGQIPPTFLIGLALGWICLRTRSLWPCILAHAVHNSVGVFAEMFAPGAIPGYNTPPELLQYQPAWFTAIGVAALAIGVLGMVFATRGMLEPEPDAPA